MNLHIRHAFKLRKLLGASAMAAGFLLVAGPAQAQSRPSLADLQKQIDCLNLPTVLVHVPALARGSYQNNGTHLTSGGGNFALVGRVDVLGSLPMFRDYFVFDLNALGDKDLVLGAQLLTFNPNGGFESNSSDTLTFVLNRVSTSVEALMDGSAGIAAYVDLADGPVYGTYIASAAANNQQITIALSDQAVRDINRARAIPVVQHQIAIGGTISAPDLGTTVGSAFFLGFADNFPLTNTDLTLNIKHYTQACPMPTDTQYQ